MRVLVTGAAGFLGAAVARRLAANGWEVEALDLVHPSESRRLDGVKLAAYHWASLDDVHEVPEFVVHCAAATDVMQANKSPRHTYAATVSGTIAILEAARRKKARVVVISSHSAYGKSERQPIPEDEPLRPSTVYGSAKAAQEQLALAYHRSHGLDVRIVRPATLYGEMGRASLPVSTFLRKILAGETIQISGDGSQVRDQNYIENAVDGIVSALAPGGQVWSDSLAGEIFNIGSGVGISVLELVYACEKALQARAKIELTPARFGEEGKVVLDITKAKNMLGYTPKIDLTEGLRRTATWMRNGK